MNKLTVFPGTGERVGRSALALLVSVWFSVALAAPLGLPTEPVPASNPMTPAKIALGD